MEADTSPEARVVQDSVLRAMGPARRLSLALEMSESMRSLTLAGIARRHPQMSSDERLAELVRVTLGSNLGP